MDLYSIIQSPSLQGPKEADSFEICEKHLNQSNFTNKASYILGYICKCHFSYHFKACKRKYIVLKYMYIVSQPTPVNLETTPRVPYE